MEHNLKITGIRFSSEIPSSSNDYSFQTNWINWLKTTKTVKPVKAQQTFHSESGWMVSFRAMFQMAEFQHYCPGLLFSYITSFLYSASQLMSFQFYIYFSVTKDAASTFPIRFKNGLFESYYIYLFFQVESLVFSVMHVMNIGCTIIS